MVKWKNVRLIFQREIRDQLRDRRTLFMVAVLPLLLYPALGLGMVHLNSVFSEQPRTVVVLGAKHLPPPPLIEGNHFAAHWFRQEQSARKLKVITDDGQEDASRSEAEADRLRDILQQAELIRAKLEERNRLEAAAVEARSAGDEPRRQELSAAASAAKAELGKSFAASPIQVLVIIPRDFDRNIERVNRQLSAHEAEAEVAVDTPRPILVHNNADEKSHIAFNRVREAIDAWENAILVERLKLAHLPKTLSTPVNPISENLALERQVAANLWSKLFPALLVIMAVTGAFYPAVDLVAGEKERGTMETLLICPATRTEIVLGKFLTVMCFSVSTALLNLMSMGITGHRIVSMMGRGLTQRVDLALPSPLAMLSIVVFLIPLAAMFSALCLALATFARSSKEGQYYLTPLLMVTMGLTVFCVSPGIEITPYYSMMPIAGPALLLKGLLLAPLDGSGLYLYIIPVLLTTLLYSALALWWAIDQFQREEVLFREAERFELRLWIRHLLRDKEPVPTFAEAGFCFVLIMLLQFAAMNVVGAAASGQPMTSDAMLRILLVQQIAIVASPALFMGLMLTTSVARTFRLRLPRWDMLLVAIVLACASHPIALALQEHLQWFIPQLPEEVGAVLQTIADPHQSVFAVLLAFAIVPAICEELAFRGFILSGFHRTGRTALAIVLSSIAFGVMHMIAQQIFNAVLLGIVLGLIAIRANSIYPCILFHCIFNSLSIAHQRIGSACKGHDIRNGMVIIENGAVQYTWGTILIASLVFFYTLRYLLRQPPQPEASGSWTSDDETYFRNRRELAPSSWSVAGTTEK